MGLEFHVGATAWEELREEFKRVLEEESATLVLGVGLASGEESHVHTHGETEFTRAVRKLAGEMEERLGVKTHLHLHQNSGSITYLLENVKGEELVDRFQELVEETARCGECFLTGVEGEVRVGEELVALVFGSSAKASFILPSPDGRRLKVIEALLPA